MLVIKKKVSLEFLGEEYKDAFIIFQSIPIEDYGTILNSSKQGEEAVKFILATIKKYFISGKFPDDKGVLQDIQKDELGQLDEETAVRCFEILSGLSAGSQTDPLASESEKPSKMGQQPQ